jgi:hypothetical protein
MIELCAVTKRVNRPPIGLPRANPEWSGGSAARSCRDFRPVLQNQPSTLIRFIMARTPLRIHQEHESMRSTEFSSISLLHTWDLRWRQIGYHRMVGVTDGNRLYARTHIKRASQPEWLYCDAAWRLKHLGCCRSGIRPPGENRTMQPPIDDQGVFAPLHSKLSVINLLITDRPQVAAGDRTHCCPKRRQVFASETGRTSNAFLAKTALYSTRQSGDAGINPVAKTAQSRLSEVGD